MKFRRKQVEPFGFVGTGMYKQAPTHWMYYRKDFTNKHVQFMLNSEPEQTVGVFELTPAQFNQFTSGKLSLIPPGGCDPSALGRPSVANPKIIFKGRVKTISHLMHLFGLSHVYAHHKAVEKQMKKKPFT